MLALILRHRCWVLYVADAHVVDVHVVNVHVVNVCILVLYVSLL
jgi:hypothetical protein